jgi:hypothetical protein
MLPRTSSEFIIIKFIFIKRANNVMNKKEKLLIARWEKLVKIWDHSFKFVVKDDGLLYVVDNINCDEIFQLQLVKPSGKARPWEKEVYELKNN